MAKAVIYFRVSDDRQVEGTSLQTQEDQCASLVERRGWELDSAWGEEGESAKTAQRPVLQAMLAYCHKNRSRIDYVVFPKIDRMARYLLDYLRVKETLAADGIRMVSVGEQIDESPAGRFTEHIMAAQAQFDNEQRAERCKGGMEAAIRREGRWVWKAPFGYKNLKLLGRPNIVPSEEAHIVRWAFEEVAARRHSPDEAFEIAKRQGFPHARSQFYKMLANPVYMGLIRSFGGEWAGSFAPVIDDDLFRRTQTALKRVGSGKRAYRFEHPDFPLKATLRCPCGAWVTGSWCKTIYPYYRCHACGDLNLRREDAHTRFKRLLAFYSLTGNEAECLSGDIRRTVHVESASAEQARAEVQRRIARAKEMQRGIALKSAAGVIPDDVARQEFERLEGELEGLSDDMNALKSPQEVDQAAVAFGIDFLTRLDGAWEDAQPQIQVQLQRHFFPEGVIGHKKRDFAISGSPLQELKIGVQSRLSSGLVDQRISSCNFQVKFLSGIEALLDGSRAVGSSRT